MTRPETCGAVGGAISLWVNGTECPSFSRGIVSSYGSSTGFIISCYSEKLWYNYSLTQYKVQMGS